MESSSTRLRITCPTLQSWASPGRPVRALHLVGTQHMLVGQRNNLIHSSVRVFLALPQKEPVGLYHFSDPHQPSPAQESWGTHMMEAYVTINGVSPQNHTHKGPAHLPHATPQRGMFCGSWFKCHSRNSPTKPVHLTFLLPACLITCNCLLGK